MSFILVCTLLLDYHSPVAMAYPNAAMTGFVHVVVINVLTVWLPGSVHTHYIMVYNWLISLKLMIAQISAYPSAQI